GGFLEIDRRPFVPPTIYCATDDHQITAVLVAAHGPERGELLQSSSMGRSNRGEHFIVESRVIIRQLHLRLLLCGRSPRGAAAEHPRGDVTLPRRAEA